MAKTNSRKSTGTASSTGLEDGQTDHGGDASPAERDEISQQNAIFDKLGGERMSGGYVEIHRRAINETQYAFLDPMPIENYVEGGGKIVLKNQYGGGDYKLVAKTSRNVIVTSWTEKIDLRIPAKHPGMVQGAESKNDFSSAIRELKEMMKPFLDKALAPTAPAVSSLSEISPILQAALARPEPAQDMSMFKFLIEVQQKSEARFERLLEKMSEKSEKGGGLKSQLEDLMALKDLFESDAPSEKKSELMELVKAFAPALMPLIQGAIQNGAAAPMVAAQPQIAERPIAERAAMPVQEPPTDPMNAQLSFMLSNFKRSALEAARKGEDAVDFAVGVLRFIPKDYLPKVFGIANSEDWFTQIFKDDSEAMKYLEFITTMRNAILARSVVFVAASRAAIKAEAVAKDLIASLHPSFRNYLYDETDPENWKDLFADSGLDPAWSEQLRVSLDALLNGDDNANANTSGAKAAGS